MGASGALAALGAVIAGAPAEIAAGATIATVVGPALIMATAVAGAAAVAAYGGYRLFKYMQAKGRETKMKGQPSAGNLAAA